MLQTALSSAVCIFCNCNKSENEENIISLIRSLRRWKFMNYSMKNFLKSLKHERVAKLFHFSSSWSSWTAKRSALQRKSQVDNGKWNLNNLYLINLKENPFFDVALENQFSDFEVFQAMFKNVFLSLGKLIPSSILFL